MSGGLIQVVPFMVGKGRTHKWIKAIHTVVVQLVLSVRQVTPLQKLGRFGSQLKRRCQKKGILNSVFGDS